MTFQELFESYVLASAEHQEHGQEVVGGRPFSADLDEGVVELGDLRARAELLGTEATGPGSWLWSWANEGGYGDGVLRAARHARDVGEREGVPELTTAELPLDGSPVGYRCAVVACGLAGGYVYYPVEAAPGTTAYLLLDAPALALPPVSPARAVTVVTGVAASGQVTDWHRALLSYASLRGLEAHPDDRGVELRAGDQGTVRVDLDELGRVAAVQGHLEAHRG